MKIKIRGFIMGKKGELYADCRDNYDLNTSAHKFAIADGVSRSFFPGIWSELLVTQFVNDSNSTNPETIINTCQQQWYEKVTEIVNKPDIKYYTRNAYNRNTPGLSTFVGLRFLEQEKKWQSVALGDSFLFFIPHDFSDFQQALIVQSSKEGPPEFDNFPDYYASIGYQHKGNKTEREGELTAGTFYLMTDALAEWFLKQGENALNIVAVWNDQQHFERYINERRDQGEINNDDTTILIIELTDDGKVGFTYEKPNVSNIKDLIATQEKEQAEEMANKPITDMPESEMVSTKKKEPGSAGPLNTDFESPEIETPEIETKK